ncbi:hypothetical protein [Kocuria sabuli]|uniref:hypothetical protein n=1 Tax=Kocuria sabuli TaxID=3071448 RepID=UPI0034D547BE
MTAGRNDDASTTADQPGPRRTGPLYWVLRVLVRLVPIVVAMRVSFEVMLRNDWFLWNPHLGPGLIAMLIAFVPAGIWAVADGYRLVPTGQVVGLWAVVGAAVVFVHHLFVGVFGFFQGMPLTAMEIVRWAEAALGIAGMHAAPAAVLTLLGAALYRFRNTRATRNSTSPAESGA